MRAPPSCLSHKVNAIRNINNELKKPGSIPNDYTMVAVAVMTLLEVILIISKPKTVTGANPSAKCLAGEPTACIIHRKGLQLMVQCRGGLENLGFDGAAQRTISWYAFVQTTHPTHQLIIREQGRHLLCDSPPSKTKPQTHPSARCWRISNPRLHDRRFKRAAASIDEIVGLEPEDHLSLAAATILD